MKDRILKYTPIKVYKKRIVLKWFNKRTKWKKDRQTQVVEQNREKGEKDKQIEIEKIRWGVGCAGGWLSGYILKFYFSHFFTNGSG